MEAPSNYAVGDNWDKKTYSDAKAYCENEGKELAYFEDEASFDKFHSELPNSETWVGAKLVNIGESRKFQVMPYAVQQY